LDRTSLIRFGEFEVNLASGELWKDGKRIKLQEQPFQALAALIEHHGEVVTREELQGRLWPADIVVDFDRGINKAINRVREALGDDVDSPRFIETLPQRGYRFLVPVETGLAGLSPPQLEPEANAIVPSPASSVVTRRTLLVAGGGLSLLLLPTVGYYFLHTGQTQIESIAVLPLENLSGDPSREYFSDGLTDELIGEIARIGSLRVISRTSTIRYKGGGRKTLPEIARELNVDAILEGTVVQSGQRVRITAQLIRARDDRHLWSEEYERDLGDILALQGEVARTIAAEVKINLTAGEKMNLARTRRVIPEAYQAYLRGNFFLQKGLPGVARSIEFFKQAIGIDGSHAESHAGLAEALCYAAIYGLQPSSETYPAARVAALKALELDQSNASARNALANVRAGYDWDLAGAVADYQRALILNPSQLLTRLWYAEHLTRMGRFDDAIAESGRAIELDPVSPNGLVNRSMLYFRARRYDEAIPVSRQAVDLDPNFVNARWWQGMSYAGNRDFPSAIACLTGAVSMTDGPLFRALLAHVHGLAGNRAMAHQLLAELTTIARERYVSPIDFAIVFAGLGDANSTFDWLDKAYHARAARIHELQSMYFDGVRSDPRYASLARRVGLRS
jgi:TolB-like protein/DNA-binding winged helix-turn-helix (wHTH) protein